jgi:SsrA-binding protein
MSASKNKKTAMLADGSTVATNRKARHEYHILDTVEAGMVLVGTEVKSLRTGKVSIAEAFARLKEGEVWLSNMHIQPYEMGNRFNPTDTRRDRKLLLHRREIEKLEGKLGAPGTSLVPLKVYFTRGRAKVQIALARGKKAHDKRDTIRERDQKRELDRIKKTYKVA